VPRSKLKELKARKDAQQPGLYILFDEDTERQSAYIGQSENIVERLLSHNSTREDDVWNTAIAFVGHLDSTFIKYLESISLDLAKRANRYSIFNSAAPKENTLSEAQKIVANEYFERIKLIMGMLGHTLFDVVSESVVGAGVYYLKADGANAKAQLLNDGSINVLSGSTARIHETAAFGGWSKTARQRFIEDKILIDSGDGVSYTFTQDLVFSSPSAAAATVTGRPINGWTAWKDENGVTLDQNVRQ
jgi:hypothetical protein